MFLLTIVGAVLSLIKYNVTLDNYESVVYVYRANMLVNENAELFHVVREL